MIAEEQNPEASSPLLRLFIFILLIGSLVWGSLFISKEKERKNKSREIVYFWHCWTGEWKENVIDKIVLRFNNSQSRYQVVALSIPFDSSEQKFLLSVAGGKPPDCVALWGPTLSAWAEKGIIEPLNRFMTPGEWAQYQRDAYPVVLKVATYKGLLYGVPTNMNTYACYFNPKQLREAGLDPAQFPKTLEELLVWGRKLTKTDSNGHLTRIGFMPVGLERYAPLFGGGFWDKATQRVTINTPENVRALSFLTDCWREFGVDRVMRFRSSLNTGGFSTEWPFISGQESITLDGQWRIEQLAKYAPQLEYGTAPLPPPRGGTPDGCYGGVNRLIIPKGAANTAGAWAFIRFWSGIENPERAAEFYVAGGWLPTTTGIARTPVYQQYLAKFPKFQTFIKLLPENMNVPPPVPYQQLVSDVLLHAEEFSERGLQTPQAALAEAQEKIDREVNRRQRLGL